MSEIKERIEMNIRAEVRNFLKKDIPLPKRDPRWNDFIAKAIIEERKALLEDVELKHMADYHTAESNLKRRFGENRNGLSYDEWLEKAKSFYTIDGSFVTSIARSKEKEDAVNTGGPWQAQKRVITLIATKYRDHFDRGYDFAWDPDEGEKK